MSARSVGRPSVAVLSRTRVAEAALKLLDRSEGDGFTMAQLAAELRVRPSALYNHFDGKDDVIAAVRELVSDRIDVTCFAEQPWPEAVVTWARSYRGAFAAHPPTIAMFATMPLSGAARTQQMYETVVRAFRAAGWPEAHVLSAIVAVESFVLGSALDAVAPEDMFDPEGSEVQFPAFADAYAARAAAVPPAIRDDAPPHERCHRFADAAFEVGISALVTGLAEQLAAFTDGTPPPAS